MPFPPNLLPVRRANRKGVGFLLLDGRCFFFFFGDISPPWSGDACTSTGEGPLARRKAVGRSLGVEDVVAVCGGLCRGFKVKCLDGGRLCGG